jgi:hypothetical protein
VASDAISTISDAASLGENLKDRYPINLADVQQVARDARAVTTLFLSELLPVTQETADAAGRYADTAGSAVSVISDVAGLGESLKTASPIPEAKVRQALADAKRITSLFLNDLLPVAQEEADAAGLYADAAGSATSAISSTLGLTAQLFADYQSPSDAQINRVIADGDRIIAAVNTAAQRYSTEGLTAAQAYGDALGGIVDALMGTGQLVEALKYGNDYTIDPKVMAQFESSSRTILEIGGRLGEYASQQSYTGLETAAGALSSWYDSLSKAALVPWGDLPATAGMMGGMAGGGSAGSGGGTTISGPISIQIVQQPGQNGAQLGQEIVATLSSRVFGRRAT